MFAVLGIQPIKFDKGHSCPFMRLQNTTRMMNKCVDDLDRRVDKLSAPGQVPARTDQLRCLTC